jgi:hypothetical protein
MSGLVTIAVAGDPAEADAICGVLERAGIPTSLEGAEGELGGEPHDGPCRILVADGSADAARDALEEAERLGEDA